MTATSLQGKHTIVTGGSRGIGKGIAHELARRGASVLLTYNSSRTQAEDVVTEIKKLGVDATAVEAKGGDLAAPGTVVKAAAERWGCIDIIINNAGAREDHEFEAMTHDIWDRQLTTNLQFPVFLIKEATPFFGSAPRIVNMSSIYAHDGHAGSLAYVGSKGALESITRSLARELGHRYNATVNCISPGPVGTELWTQSTADPNASKEWDSIIQNTPAAPRVAAVDDIAQIAAFLAEEGSRWITGSVVNANGGLLFN
jgi:3-oxoacyl-[acyl-carrier protein] reductase